MRNREKTMRLSHLDDSGAARMVDVSGKSKVKRTAKAKGTILLQAETIELIKDGLVEKGDVLAAARIAGISAAKKTWDLIPKRLSLLRLKRASA